MTNTQVIDKIEHVRNHSLLLTIVLNPVAVKSLNAPHISTRLIKQTTGQHILLQQRRDFIIRVIESSHNILNETLKVATLTRQVMLVIN